MIHLIAHRGASYEEPENTLSSIKRAIEIGVDFIELDVHLSADGIPIVIHDHTFCRTTNAEKGLFVRKTFLHEMKNFDAGSWFKGKITEEKVPTLEEVLKINFGNTGLMIEIKDDVQHDLSSSVMKILQDHHLEKTLIGSFSAETLNYIRIHYPEQPVIGLLFQLEKLPEMQSLSLNRLAVDYKIIDEDFIKKLDFPIILWSWTVDDPEIAKRLITLGVEGIITNRPRIMKKIIQKISRESIKTHLNR